MKYKQNYSLLFFVLILFALCGCTSTGTTTATTEVPVESSKNQLIIDVFDNRTYTELPDSDKPEDNLFTTTVKLTTKDVFINAICTPVFSLNGGPSNIAHYLCFNSTTKYSWYYNSSKPETSYLTLNTNIYDDSTPGYNLNFRMENYKYYTYYGIAKFGITVDVKISSGSSTMNPSPVVKTIFSAL